VVAAEAEVVFRVEDTQAHVARSAASVTQAHAAIARSAASVTQAHAAIARSATAPTTTGLQLLLLVVMGT